MTASTASPISSPLTLEQGTALELMLKFLQNPDQQFFLLSGYAGTGKTFCIQHLVPLVRGRLIFTAPTNKATKVLRDTITNDAYKPECRTIYSLLGLRLEANGEVKELAEPEDPLDLTQYRAVIVDEASMVNSNLFNFITRVAGAQKVKFIFMGDPAQLPPVGESKSPIWVSANAVAELHHVMRHDNQILALATAIRKIVDHPAPKLKIESSNADGEGVWRLAEGEFEARIMESADRGRFSQPNIAKAIAWRNATVDTLNRRIRERIFDNSASSPWLVDDRVLLMEPAKDLSGEIAGTTDDEGRVTRVEPDWHPEWREFKIWRINVTTDDNRPIILRVLHEDCLRMHTEKVEQLAQAARLDRRKWGTFWEFKEAFHKLRHGYAITAHRAQGSTYEAAFVDWKDILLNRNRSEAYRCLYVACTRPKKELYLG
jgi:exodeoxyribonuclease-5